MQLSRDYFQKNENPPWKEVLKLARSPKTGLSPKVMARRAAAINVMNEETETLAEFEKISSMEVPGWMDYFKSAVGMETSEKKKVREEIERVALKERKRVIHML